MQHLGKYQLIRRLGSGGMAEVFLARTTVAHGLIKELVIKKIHPAYARYRELVSMFVSEAKVALGLNHPNIVQVFDFGTMDEAFFLAMEYVAGVDLLHLLRESAAQKRPVPIPLCVYIVKELVKGLDYAHRKTDDHGEPLGIVHRDVSPHNVLLSWDGAVKLVDFGIARVRGDDEQRGGIKGKFSYMSPEQARGEEVDRRSDIFSAGVVLFELCCGRPLFPGRGARVLDRVKTGAFPRPRDVNPAIPPQLERTLLEALSFHPSDRFSTARELQLALDEFLFHHAERASDLSGPDSLADFLSTLIPRSSESGERGLADGTPTGDSRHEDDEDTVLLDEIDPDVTPARRTVRLVTRERKHIVVVEARLRGAAGLAATLGKERADRVAGAFFSALRDIAFKHHGHVHEVWADGATLLVGLPLAGEDDASRAIRMGLALIDALRAIAGDLESDLALSLGIQRGVAEISRDSRGSREVTLDPVQRVLAECLVERAGAGEILVGSQIHRMANRAWYFEQLARVPVSGAMSELLDESVDDLPVLAVHEVTGNGVVSAQRRSDRAARKDAGPGEGPLAVERQTPPGISALPTVTGSIRAYRLRGAKKRAQRLREDVARADVLLGRQLEVKALLDAYRDALTAGRKRVVLLLGEAGVGKRTLVNGFLSHIRRDETLLMRAAPQVHRAYTPYAVLADLARDLLGLTDESTATDVVAAVNGFLPMLYGGHVDPAVASRDIAAVARLFGAELTAGDVRGLDAGELRQRVAQLLIRVELNMMPEKPLVFVCEDLHWADDESLDLFGETLSKPGKRPLLGILTSRPDARVSQFAGDINAEVVRLGDLDLPSITELVARRLGRKGQIDHAMIDTPGGPGWLGATAPRAPAALNPAEIEELARQIYACAGGNPFFVGELLDNVIERGMLASGSDLPDSIEDELLTASLRGDDPPSFELDNRSSEASRDERMIVRDLLGAVPSSVEALLSARIDRLPESEKQTLLHAAVLGRSVRAEAVSALSSRSAEEDLAALCTRGLLHGRPDGIYVFPNELALAVAYRLVPDDGRPRLHRAAASALLAAPGYRRGPDDTSIAYHFEQAGDSDAAADRYLAGATYAASVGGNSDALRQLDRALELTPPGDHVRRFLVHGKRQEVLRRMARRDEQRRAIEDMRAAATALGDAGKMARAEIRLAEHAIAHGKVQAADSAARSALDHAHKAGDTLAEAHALELSAHIMASGEDAIALCDRALALCDDSRAGSRRRAPLYNTRGEILWGMGRMEEAIASFSQSLAIYRELGLWRREAGVLDNLGTVCATIGELEEALRYYKSALDIDRRLGDRAGFAGKLCNIGMAYVELGEGERGRRHLYSAIHLADEIEDAGRAAKAVIGLGKAYWLSDQPGEATATLRRGLDLARQSSERQQEVRALVWLALAELEAGGDVDELVEFARSAIDLATAIAMTMGQIHGLVARGLGLAHRGEFAEAAECSARAVAEQTRQARPENAELVLYFHAMLSEAAGRQADAVTAIEQARREVERKAACLQDQALRRTYGTSKIPRAVMTFYEHVTRHAV